jgi:hypothetical protein
MTMGFPRADGASREIFQKFLRGRDRSSVTPESATPSVTGLLRMSMRPMAARLASESGCYGLFGVGHWRPFAFMSRSLPRWMAIVTIAALEWRHDCNRTDDPSWFCSQWDPTPKGCLVGYILGSLFLRPGKTLSADISIISILSTLP